MFTACGLIGVVGASPNFRLKHEEIVHLVGAIGGITLAVISIWIEFGFWYISVFSVIAMIIIKYNPMFKKTYTYWIEVVAILAVTLTWFLFNLNQ